jgi:hypothetical protein
MSSHETQINELTGLNKSLAGRNKRLVQTSKSRKNIIAELKEAQASQKAKPLFSNDAWLGALATFFTIVGALTIFMVGSRNAAIAEQKADNDEARREEKRQKEAMQTREDQLNDIESRQKEAMQTREDQLNDIESRQKEAMQTREDRLNDIESRQLRQRPYFVAVKGGFGGLAPSTTELTLTLMNCGGAAATNLKIQLWLIAPDDFRILEHPGDVVSANTFANSHKQEFHWPEIKRSVIGTGCLVYVRLDYDDGVSSENYDDDSLCYHWVTPDIWMDANSVQMSECENSISAS